MKKLSIATIMAVITALLVATIALAMFSNGNFETGDFTGWMKDTTNQNGGILVGPPPSYVPHAAASVDDMFIVDAAWTAAHFGGSNPCDPNTNGDVCLPYAGSNSAVVNYLGKNGNLNKLYQQSLLAGGDVSADGNYHIFFAYAPVLDKGSHDPNEQPFMYVKLTRVRSGSPDKVLFDKFSYPDDLNPNWKWNSTVAYMKWQVYDLTYNSADLGPGDTLTLDVVAAGCIYSAGAHWGYVYVDEFGPLSPEESTAPSISSLTPGSGPSNGGTSVTITGTNFTGATAVSIGTSTLLTGSFTILDDTHITFTTPANAAGVVDVAVINPGGSAIYPSGFTFLPTPAPTITSIVPNSGPVTGGTSVVITGTDLTGGTVTFGATPATCNVDSATQVTCASPAHPAAGAVDVDVTTIGGIATSTNGFTYIPVPTITGIAPNSGPVAGGTSVVITGTNLASASHFEFGATPATCVVNSATQITCPSPAHAAGAVDVDVTTPGGIATSTNGFTYIPVPTITGIAPNSGPVAGGTSVVITGTNLASASHFEFGATPATCVVNSATQVTCTSPAHAAGAVDVDVTTIGGIATSTNGFTYIVPDTTPPTVLSSLRANASPSQASSVNFTVTFSETVTGVGVADFTLTPSAGITGASVTSVTPVSGKIYTISVNTGSGNGTLRLDIPANATITDLAGNPLASLPFTTGESYTLVAYSDTGLWTSAFDLPHGWTVSQTGRIVGDVNGDGKDDLIGFGADGVYVTLSTGTGFGAVSRWTTDFDLSHGWTMTETVRTAGDVDGDGKADLVGFGLNGVSVALSTGAGFGPISKWTNAFDLSHGWTVTQYVRTVGDANGDGKADLIGYGIDAVYVALSTGTGFSPVSKWSIDLVVSHGWTVAQYVRTVGDANGDGKADLIGFGLDSVYVALSTGTGFAPVSKWTNSFDLSHGWTVAQYVRTVGDVDGDGKADLVGFGLDGAYVALSTGAGFGTASKWTTAFDLSHGWTVANSVRTVGDVSGDGKIDLVGFGSDGVHVVTAR